MVLFYPILYNKILCFLFRIMNRHSHYVEGSVNWEMSPWTNIKCTCSSAYKIIQSYSSIILKSTVLWCLFLYRAVFKTIVHSQNRIYVLVNLIFICNSPLIDKYNKKGVYTNRKFYNHIFSVSFNVHTFKYTILTRWKSLYAF